MKYHQWRIGNEYGKDHSLTDNWNPNLNYGNEYVRVYFNIDTPMYDPQIGFKNAESSKAWSNEASELISVLGIVEDSGFKIENSTEKVSYLYAHPNQISGIVKKNDVKRIAEAIDKMELSSLKWVSLYETVYLISNEEYEEYLKTKDNEIKNELISKSRTTRTNKYVSLEDVAHCIANKIRLYRLGINDGKNYGAGQTANHICMIADELISIGLLKSFDENGHRYIRSLNKAEQKRHLVEQ